MRFIPFVSLWLLFWLTMGALWAQPTTTPWIQVQQRANLPEAKSIYVDKLQQTYLLTDQGAIIKYNAQGDSIFRFVSDEWGKIELLDASNPMTLLAYVPSFQRVLVLDRTLTPQGAINLTSLGYSNVQGVAYSGINGIWLYDVSAFKFRCISASQFGMLRESPDLSQVLPDDFLPDFLQESEGRLFARDPNLGFFEFDAFGNFLRRRPLNCPNHLSFVNSEAYYCSDSTNLYVLKHKEVLPQKVALPTKDFTFIQLEKKHLVLYSRTNRTLTWFRRQD